MNRALADNALLLACDDFSGRMLIGCKVVAAGGAVGLLWYGITLARAVGVI